MNNLLDVTLAGPVLFILVALVFGTIKPNYRPLHNTISELSLGKYGYIQIVNFALSGSLIAILGLRLVAAHEHLYGAITVVVMGLVLLLSAVFRTDPVAANESTTTGKIHNGLFFIGMAGIISGQFVTGLSNLGSAIGVFSLVCGVLSLVGLPVTVTRQTYMGLFQRALVLVVMLWVGVFGLSILS